MSVRNSIVCGHLFLGIRFSSINQKKLNSWMLWTLLQMLFGWVCFHKIIFIFLPIFLPTRDHRVTPLAFCLLYLKTVLLRHMITHYCILHSWTLLRKYKWNIKHGLLWVHEVSQKPMNKHFIHVTDSIHTCHSEKESEELAFGFLCVGSTLLELSLQTRLSSNS